MKTFTIDWGSYSAKVFISDTDKKKLIHNQVDEIIFPQREFADDPKAKNIPLVQTAQFQLLNHQLNEIASYLKKDWDGESKLLISPPAELYSYRYKFLPIPQKKKAMAMLPFQLEDEIPFPMTDTFLCSSFIKEGKGYHSLSFFNKKEINDALIEIFQKHNIIPDFLVHHTSAFFSLSQSLDLNTHHEYLCILDIGHKTTTAYFYASGKLIASHLTHFGGARLDEMLMNIYRLNYDQAVKFKHESSFILPRDLFSKTDLTEDQKFFAENMDLLFNPFVQEFKRWEMMYRVETKVKVGKILLIGGTSQLRNIESYLSQALERPVEKLNDIDGQCRRIKEVRKNYIYFAPGDILARVHLKPNDHPNIIGALALQKAGDAIPLYSLSFVGARSLTLSLLILLFGIAEYTYLTFQEKNINDLLKVVSQNPILNFSPIEKKQLIDSPIIMQKKMEDQVRRLKKEIKVLSETNSYNALADLTHFQKKLSNGKCKLEMYKAEVYPNRPASSNEASVGDCPSLELSKAGDSLKKSNIGIQISKSGSDDKIILKW